MRGLPRCWMLGLWMLLGACGPGVDNSGGDAPPGTPTPFEVVDITGWECSRFQTTSNTDTLVQDELQADAFVTSQCGGTAASRDWLRARVATLDAARGQVLMISSLTFGGCKAEPQLEAVHVDGDALRPWFLQADVAYGRRNVACTADLRLALRIWKVDGARAATRVERTVGVYNPELPGAPQ